MSHPDFPGPISRRDALRRIGWFGGAAAAAAVSSRLAHAANEAASPSLTGAQPGFYRFKIGTFEALAVNDGQLVLPMAQNPFGLGEPPERVQQVLEAAYLPTEEVRLAINVLLVRTPQDLILVDTGCGSAFGPVGGGLVDNLAAAGIRPEQVTIVVLTHLHGDHFGGLVRAETGEQVFKNARYVMSRREHDYWTKDPTMETSRLPAEMRAQFIQTAQQAVKVMKGKLELIAPGDRVIDGVEFLDTPGHTAGHLSVAFTSGTEQLLNLADVVHHHALSVEHPEWLLGFDTDPEAAARTRRQVLDRIATDRSRIFGGHLPFPSLGRVRSTSGKFEYVTEPWQPL